MNTLTIIVLLISTVLTSKTADATDVPYYFVNASNLFKVDISLLYAFCSKESHCRVNARNKNDAKRARKAQGIKEHAYGLFQIKLATARALGFTGTRSELMKPDVNTYYAAKLIRDLYTRYKSTKRVISAYNAGKPVDYNQEYVTDVLKYYAFYKIDRGL